MIVQGRLEYKMPYPGIAQTWPVVNNTVVMYSIRKEGTKETWDRFRSEIKPGYEVRVTGTETISREKPAIVIDGFTLINKNSVTSTAPAPNIIDCRWFPNDPSCTGEVGPNNVTPGSSTLDETYGTAGTTLEDQEAAAREKLNEDKPSDTEPTKTLTEIQQETKPEEAPPVNMKGANIVDSIIPDDFTAKQIFGIPIWLAAVAVVAFFFMRKG